MGSVQFTITEPYTPVASTGRSPQFSVSSGTQSISIVLTQVNGSPPPSPASANANLGPSSPGCTTTSTTLTCQVTAQAPAGNDSFSVLTYAQPNDSGSVIGEGALAVAVVAGQTAQAPATLTGTIASIAVTVVGSVPEGVATALPVQVVAKDSDGNTIIGTYSNPITLVDSDTSGATSLSVKSLSAAGGVTLAYTGAQMSAPVSIAASASGVSSTAITDASFSPLSTVPTIDKASTTETTSSVYTTETIGSPGPTPTPRTSSSSFTTTYSTGATFNGISGLVKMESAFPQPTASPAILDSYLLVDQGSTAGSWAYDFVGSTYSQPQMPMSSSYICSPPYSVQWIVPLPQSWNYYAAAGPCAVTETSSDPSFTYSDVGTYNADGSYSVTTTIPPSTNYYLTGAVNTYLVRSDGTALVTNNDATNGSYIIAVGTPAPGAATIPLEVQTFTGAIPTPGASATPAPVATTEPNWYSTAGLPNGVVPSPLQSGTYSTVGATSLPTQCAVPTSILGASPTITEVDYTETSFDPTFDYTKETVRSFLVDGLGDVCDLYNDAVYTNWDADFPPSVSAYNPTTYSVSTTATYVTVTSLTAAMMATKSFANALPAASQMLVLGSAAEREQMQIQARSRAERLEAQRLLALHHRFH